MVINNYLVYSGNILRKVPSEYTLANIFFYLVSLLYLGVFPLENSPCLFLMALLRMSPLLNWRDQTCPPCGVWREIEPEVGRLAHASPVEAILFVKINNEMAEMQQ